MNSMGSLNTLYSYCDLKNWMLTRLISYESGARAKWKLTLIHGDPLDPRLTNGVCIQT